MIQKIEKLLISKMNVSPERCLAVAITLMCFAQASFALRGKLAANVGQLTHWGMSTPVATLVVYLLAISLVAMGILAYLRPTARILVLTSITFVTLSLMKASMGAPLYALGFVGDGAKFFAPLAAALLLKKDSEKTNNANAVLAYRLLAFGLALTFVGHGLKCLFHEVQFFALFSAFFATTGIPPMSTEATYLALDVIGLVDVSAALVLVAQRRSALVLMYMGVWALIASTSRLFVGGWSSLDEVFIRAPYYTLPLVLLLQPALASTQLRLERGIRQLRAVLG